MQESDYKNLKIPSSIYYSGNKREIIGLRQIWSDAELRISEQIMFRDNQGFYYPWKDVCIDCYLDAPKEKKRYWLWKLKLTSWFKNPEYLDDNGINTVGDEFSSPRWGKLLWKEIEKEKLEDEWHDE